MTLSKNLNFNKTFPQKLLENVVFTFVGLLVLLLLVLSVVVLVLPILLYRWIITKFVIPKYQPAIQEIVTGTSHSMAADFLSERISFTGDVQPVLKPKKYTVVFGFTFSGTITFDQAESTITKGWLKVKEGESKLKYPEFQQYIEYSSGFMFWKQDENFSLKNHVHVYKIAEHSNSAECEEALDQLKETLMNRTYQPNRSPWEFHVLQNYKNPHLRQGKKTNEIDGHVNTVVLFAFHHALMDGISGAFAFVEGLLGQKLPSIEMAQPKLVAEKSKNPNYLVRLSKRYAYASWRSLYDLGYFVSLRWRTKTPWHVSLGQGHVLKQIYGKSELIPVEKIKFIKNQLGVHFTSVILSCIGAGAAQSFESKGFTGEYSVPLLTVVPLPVHPNKLENNFTGTFVELAAYPNLDPVTRLNISEERFLDARYNSTLPFIGLGYGKYCSALPAFLGKLLATNRGAPAIMTNFSGPGIKMNWEKENVLGMDFGIGGVPGVSGLTFGICSYSDNVRFGVIADSTVMDRKEVKDLIRAIEREMDVLYDCAMKVTKESCE